jgi:hypothetical protein
MGRFEIAKGQGPVKKRRTNKIFKTYMELIIHAPDNKYSIEVPIEDIVSVLGHYVDNCVTLNMIIDGRYENDIMRVISSIKKCKSKVKLKHGTRIVNIGSLQMTIPGEDLPF